jgi:hypothetical protein
MLAFSQFSENGMFKERLLGDGFVGSDAMYDDKPGSLVRKDGMRETLKPTKYYSFRRLYRATWEGEIAPGRAYSAEFEKWMKKVLAKTIRCVYLTGHHGPKIMWWVDRYEGETFFYMSMETVGTLEFGVIEWDTDKKTKVIQLKTDKLRDGCLLVVGSGCNVCNYSVHYQSFFKNGARKPVVLGWNSKIRIPKIEDGEPSVNGRFFDYLARYAKSNSKVPTSDKLEWFYDNEPMELVRAWGHACLAYRTKGQTGLWTYARARHSDGQYYKFTYDTTTKTAEPVKA